MNKQEIFFAGALFFAICAIGRWPSYAPVICVVCALLSAILFWRGLTLRTQARTNEKARQQEELQRRWDGRQQQLQGQHEVLLQTLESMENSLHTQEERLAACIRSVQETAEMELQCVSSIRDRMDPPAARLEADMARICEKLDLQHEDNKSNLGSIFTVILDMEKAWKELPEMLKSGSENITQNLDELREKMERDFKQTMSCTQRGWEQLEEYLSSLEEALKKQCRTMEEEGASQRSWMDDLMQKYADVTAQDLEALRLLKEV